MSASALGSRRYYIAVVVRSQQLSSHVGSADSVHRDRHCPSFGEEYIRSVKASLLLFVLNRSPSFFLPLLIPHLRNIEAILMQVRHEKAVFLLDRILVDPW